QDLQQLRIQRHQFVSLTSFRTSSVRASHSSRVGASRLRRSSGSVFDGRRLNHHDPASTVSPSSRSWSYDEYAAATCSTTAPGSSTFELISPDAAYRRKGSSSALSGPPDLDSCSSTITDAISPLSAR